MADEPGIFHNPFTQLNKGTFREKGEAQPREQKKSRSCMPHALEGDEDAQLFLQAMGQPASDAASNPSAFRMEDAPAFKEVRPVEKKKKRSKQPPQTLPPRSEKISSADLSEEPKEDAFSRAMRDVQPLTGKGRAVAPPAPHVTPSPLLDTTMQDFMDGKLEFALSMTGEYLEGHVVGLDDITMNKLRAGQYSPETHLDLHGLNTVQAFQALLGFFRSAWYKGLRTVLLVPGRGRNSPDGVGVLREKLQNWLTQEPFKRVVLAFCTARSADGGPGSVYVLLRKYRKKGKIYWERMPADPDLY